MNKHVRTRNVYTNTPLNYVYKKNTKYKWKPIILISVVMISMITVKMTIKPQGTFEDIAIMTSISVSPAETSETVELGDQYFPLEGSVTSVFAERIDPFGSGYYEEHEGIDIAAVDSTDVLAFMDGTVKATGTGNSYGNYIIITHNDEVETLYAHCEELYVKKDDKVYAGDIIAKAGNTGRSTAVHLHFEIRVNGKKVDPLPYLER